MAPGKTAALARLDLAAGNIVGGKTMETKKQDVGQTGRRDFLKLSALGAAQQELSLRLEVQQLMK